MNSDDFAPFIDKHLDDLFGGRQMKPQIVPDFHNVDFSDLPVPMITVYDHPADYPDCFVARVWNVAPTGPQATDMVMLSETLDGIRSGIPTRFMWLDRQPNDDPKIVGVWF